MIDKLQLEQVTRDLGWIRKLAHALVPSDAEDLAHDAWLVASDEMPSDRPPRRWLARVTTNLARMRGRSATRRRAREVSSIEPEPAPSPAELVERVQLQRLVAGEVVALAEPYRSTVLLHYFEGMSSVEIARRQGISDGTVRWRLKGALDEIRDRLRSREDAPKGGWLAMLAPLARPIHHEAEPVGIASGTVALLGVAIVATLVAVMIVLVQRSHSDEPVDVAVAAPAIARVFPTTRDPDPASDSSRDPSVFAQPEAPSHRVAGKVTSHGATIAGATVRIGVVVAVHRPNAMPGSGATAEPVAEVVTGQDGTFDFGELPPASYTIVAASPSLAPSAVSVTLGDPTLHADRLAVELADCDLRVSGVVRDANQHPIARAHVAVQGLASVDTTGDGHYSVCLPADASVRVSAQGFASLETTPAGRGDTARDFDLVPETTVVGTVVDQQDHPVAGARIVASPTGWQRHADMYATQLWAIADDDGRFAIAGMAAGEFDLVAVHPGVVDSSGQVVTTRVKHPTETRLVVRTGARIRGQLTHAGQPVAGGRVLAKSWGSMNTTAVSQADGTFVIDGVPFGDAVIAAGGVRKDLVVDRREVNVELDVSSVHVITGSIHRDGRPVALARVTCMPASIIDEDASSIASDAEGRYTCNGGPGTHIIASAECDHGRSTQSFAKGTSTDIELPACVSTPRALHVRGDVRTRSGSPLAGAEVWFTDGAHVISDADGGFTIDITPEAAPRVYPRNHMWGYLLVSGPDAVPTGLPIVDELPLHLVVTGDPASAVGHVADREGHAIAGARVTVRCGQPLDRRDRDATHTAVTRADGWFSVPNVVGMPQGCSVDVFTGTDNVTLPWTGAFLDVVVGAPQTAYVALREWSRAPTVTARSVATGDAVTAEVDGATAELRDIVPGWYEIAADDGDYRAVKTARLGDASPPVLTRWTLVGNEPGNNSFHIVDVDTGRPVPGMACESSLGAGNVVAVSDASGTVTMPKRADPNCWSSRGPWVPAWAHGDNNVITTVLERPGTANPGFVVGPESARLVVEVIDANSAASTAGLRVGDRVVELDGAGVSQLPPRELMYLVWTHAAGTMHVGVERNGTKLTVAIAIP